MPWWFVCSRYNNAMLAWMLVLLLTPFVLFVAIRFHVRWFMPVASAVVIYAGFVLEIQSSMGRAFALLIGWTIWHSAFVLRLAYNRPEEAKAVIWRAEEYTDSMFRWVETSELPEGAPASVILFHLKQSVLYCVAALVSGNVLSLILGSALLNYMNYYVAQLARRSKMPSFALLLGWNPWSVIRVLSFLWLGLVLSLPVLSRFLPVAGGFSWMQLVPGLAGIALDMVLKITAGPGWSRLLKLNLK